MTPGIWSVLIIFVAAPLALAFVVTIVVLLTTLPPGPSAHGGGDGHEEKYAETEDPGDSDEADHTPE